MGLAFPKAVLTSPWPELGCGDWVLGVDRGEDDTTGEEDVFGEEARSESSRGEETQDEEARMGDGS